MINPRESSGFYVIIIFDHEVGAPFQTGPSIKGQNLVYKISRASEAQHPLISEKEIECGSINLKDLVLQK